MPFQWNKPSYNTETTYVQCIKKVNNVRKGTVQVIVYYYNIRYGMLGNNYYSREGRDLLLGISISLPLNLLNLHWYDYVIYTFHIAPLKISTLL